VFLVSLAKDLLDPIRREIIVPESFEKCDCLGRHWLVSGPKGIGKDARDRRRAGSAHPEIVDVDAAGAQDRPERRLLDCILNRLKQVGHAI
jgi:hypothetical protein